MRNLLDNPYLQLAARFILGGFFIVAAVGKIAAPEAFAKEISNYQILPLSLVNLTAIFLPWLELVTGVAIVAGIWIRANALLITAMLVVFTIAIISALARGLEIDCGCFAQSADKADWLTVARDLGLLALSLYLYVIPSRKFSLDALAYRGIPA